MSFRKKCTCCGKILEKKDITPIGKTDYRSKLLIWYNCNNCKSTLVTTIKSNNGLTTKD